MRRTAVPGVDAMRAHVQRLCDEHGLLLGKGLPGSAFAFRADASDLFLRAAGRGTTGRAVAVARRGGPTARVVVADPVADEITYLDALHEIGHHLAAGRSARRVLEREANVWAWALKTARSPVTPGGRAHVRHCLRTYFARSARRLPPDDHAFWELASLPSPAQVQADPGEWPRMRAAAIEMGMRDPGEQPAGPWAAPPASPARR